MTENHLLYPYVFAAPDFTLGAQAVPQTFLSSALNIFSPKSIRYCINTTRYLQRRINLYSQVILTRECNPPLSKAKLNYATMVVSTLEKLSLTES